MRVIILSQIDYAGSGFKMFHAIRRHNEDIWINLFSGKPDNNYCHPVHNLVYNENRAAVENLLKTVDIIHFKGDWPPRNGYLDMNIPQKKIVITTSGSFFRKKEHGGLGTFTVNDYGRVNLMTSFEPDLLYPEFSDIWTPHPIDCEDKPILPRPRKPVFLHMPTTEARKGTDFVRQVFDILKSKIDCETIIASGMRFTQAAAMKQNVTVYFDQFFVGFYGNSALEAMQWGVPVCAWISPMAIEQAKGKLKGCPVINEDMSDPERTAARVIKVIEDDNLKRRTKAWCNRVHSFRSVAKQWRTLYEHLLKS